MENGKSYITKGSGRLFLDPNAEYLEGQFRPLRGLIIFEFIGRQGHQEFPAEITAHPKIVNGASIYELEMEGNTGIMQRLELPDSNFREYAGHMGCSNDFLLFGILRSASIDFDEHIEIHAILTSGASRKSKEEIDIDSMSIEI